MTSWNDVLFDFEKNVVRPANTQDSGIFFFF